MADLRILFTTTSGAGHFGALVPIINAASAAGHSVAVAGPEESERMVRDRGFEFKPFDGVPPDSPERAAVFSQLGKIPYEEFGVLVGREIFGRVNTTAALPRMIDTVRGWRPDVVVSEAGEASGVIAADAAGIPSVRVNPGLVSGTHSMFDAVVASGITELRESAGVQPDADGQALRAKPQISYFPHEFDPVDVPELLRIRDPRFAPANESERQDFVYITFGSESGGMPFIGDVLRSAAAAVAAVGLKAVVSVGRSADPELLAGAAGDIQVEEWVDTAEMVRTAQLVICHAGAGTTLAALSAGAPILAVPLFAEQPMNAERVVATDAGLRVDMGPDLAGRMETAVRALTTEAPAGCRRMSNAIAALPGVDQAIARIESVVS